MERRRQSDPGPDREDLRYMEAQLWPTPHAMAGPRGLSKASIQIRFTAIAYNLKRTLNIFALAA